MADSESDDSQKTEDPTPKKLADARKRGEVAKSREVNHFIMLMAATIMVLFLIPGFLNKMAHLLEPFIAMPDQLTLSGGQLRTALANLFLGLLKALFLPILLLVVAAALTGIIQNGFMYSAESIIPKLDKISPMAGLKRMFSMQSVMEFAKGIAKLAIIGVVGMFVVWPFIGAVDHFTGLVPALMLTEIYTIAWRLMLGVAIVMGVIAGLDMLYQKMEFTKKMRMTKQEVKDEHKQSEGDPMVKARLRQLRSEKARRRMMADVPKADVIITNPTHYAVALAYMPKEHAAPVLLAKGIDDVALKIREIAEDNDITIMENPPLARAIYATVEIEEPIQPEQYKAVAEIISYVFKLKGKKMEDA